ncbi:MAG: hypothetical protein LUG26_06845 [Ruminococcus sp.]|nr:hypothetical protein [Ruminococcus sp.]
MNENTAKKPTGEHSHLEMLEKLLSSTKYRKVQIKRLTGKTGGFVKAMLTIPSVFFVVYKVKEVIL